MKILIVDDDPSLAEILKQGLEAKMFLVETAADGERGAFLGRTGCYDLIILDYILPKLSGPEVLQAIRHENKSVPIIMLSVKAELADKQEIFGLGADDFLTKPFLFEELWLRIRALLRRPARTRTGVLKLDNLALNMETQITKRAGREIYLTRREFSLLEYLLRRRGQIVSRQELLENVWNYNADPFSNSIETHIASLRRKLNFKNNRDLIHTFTGRGYKLSLKKID
jgi:DNA-binding response OmpR family regulator